MLSRIGSRHAQMALFATALVSSLLPGCADGHGARREDAAAPAEIVESAKANNPAQTPDVQLDAGARADADTSDPRRDASSATEADASDPGRDASSATDAACDGGCDAGKPTLAAPDCRANPSACSGALRWRLSMDDIDESASMRFPFTAADDGTVVMAYGGPKAQLAGKPVLTNAAFDVHGGAALLHVSSTGEVVEQLGLPLAQLDGIFRLRWAYGDVASTLIISGEDQPTLARAPGQPPVPYEFPEGMQRLDGGREIWMSIDVPANTTVAECGVGRGRLTLLDRVEVSTGRRLMRRCLRGPIALQALRALPSGGVVVSLWLRDPMEDPGAEPVADLGAGPFPLVVLKDYLAAWNADGSLRYARDAGNDSLQSLAVGGDDDVWALGGASAVKNRFSHFDSNGLLRAQGEFRTVVWQLKVDSAGYAVLTERGAGSVRTSSLRKLASDGSVVWEQLLEPNDAPGWLAVDRAGRIYGISNGAGRTLTMYDP